MSNGFIFTLWCCITTVVLQHHFIATPRIQALEKQLRRAVARNTQLEQVEQIDEPGIRRNTNKDGLMEIELEQQHSIHQGKHGIFVTSLLDPWVGGSLREYGEWSEQELHLFKSIVSVGDIVIDAGANIGAFTIPLAKHVGPLGRVFAFEAQRRLHHLLSANIALNNLMNVRNPHVALGDAVGASIQVPNVNFTVEGNFGGVSLVDRTYPASQTHTIQKVNLDDWFFDQWLLKGTEMEDSTKGAASRICPKLVKIDVEGMEEHIVRGFMDGIKRCQPVLYVENNCVKDSPLLLHLLMDVLNYDVVWDVTPYYSKDNYKHSKRDLFHGLMSVNVLAVPQTLETSLKDLYFGQRTRVAKNGSYYLKDYAKSVSVLIGRPMQWVATLQTGNRSYCKR